MSILPGICRSIKRIWRKVMVLFCLLLLASCTASLQPVPVDIEPGAASLQTLALLRPTWDGTRPDAFCQPDIGDDILWQLKQSLLERGYRVVDFKVPPLENSNRPDPVASWSGAELRQRAPKSADGIFRLRIVEYLDASLCDSAHEMKSLGITAIAEIFDQKSGRLLWQTRQLSSDISRSTKDIVYSCAVELAQRIGERLPRASR